MRNGLSRAFFLLFLRRRVPILPIHSAYSTQKFSPENPISKRTKRILMEYGFAPRRGNQEIVIKVNLSGSSDAQRAVFDSRQPRVARNWLSDACNVKISGLPAGWAGCLYVGMSAYVGTCTYVYLFALFVT